MTIFVRPTAVLSAPVGTLFDQIGSEARIRRLVETREPESATLEYKTQPAAARINGHRIAESVSAFANTLGGTMVWGVATGKGADKNIPTAVEPLEQGRADALRQAIGALIRHPIDRLREKLIPAGGGGEYYVLEVPQSALSPHQVLGTGRYYRREGPGNVPMSHDIVELHFGRRLGPVLDIIVDLSYRGESPGEPLTDGQRVFDLIVSLRNVGRRAARFPHVAVRVPASERTRIATRLLVGSPLLHSRQGAWDVLSRTDNTGVIYIGSEHRFLSVPLVLPDDWRGPDHLCAYVDVFADDMAARRSAVWLENIGSESTRAKWRTDALESRDREPVAVRWPA